MSTSSPVTRSKYLADLPVGGQIELLNADELALWDEAKRRYIDDYGLRRTNDLVLLGAVLSQVVEMFRAQMDMADAKKAGGAAARIGKCSERIQEIEKALGIDKKSREAGGHHTVQDYVERLRRAAREKGIRIAERVLEYERVMMEARWKLRMLANADPEDLRHHGLTKDTFIDWLRDELEQIEQNDKRWAKTKGKVFVGRV